MVRNNLKMHFFFVFITMNEFNINKFLIERKMLNIHPKFGLDGYNEVRNRKKKERKKEKTIILLESSVALLLFACNKNEKK